MWWRIRMRQVAVLQVARRRAASIRCLHSWSYLLLKQSFFRLAQGSSPSPCVHPLEPHAKFSFLSLIPFWFATGQGSLLFSFARWLSFHVSRMCVSSHRLSFSGLRLVPSFFFLLLLLAPDWWRKTDATTHLARAQHAHSLSQGSSRGRENQGWVSSSLWFPQWLNFTWLMWSFK